MSYTQDPLYGIHGSGSSMGQQGLPGEFYVDPQALTLDQALPGGTGLSQDFVTTGHLQLGYATSGYPQSSGAGSRYLNTPYPALSVDDFGVRT